MRPFLVIAAALALMAEPTAFAAAPKPQKRWNTYPQPPKLKPADPLHVNPGYQIPEYPERYSWKVTTKLNGKVVFPEGVPVYSFKGGKRGAQVARVPADTEMKLDSVREWGGLLYYALTYEGQELWINGASVEPTAYKPPDQ